MKRFLFCLAAVGGFLFANKPLRATSLNVDFGIGGANVQSGFNDFSYAATAPGEADLNSGSQTMTYSGIAVNISTPDAGYMNGGGEVFTEFRDRGAVSGTGLNNLLRDFVFARGGDLTLTLSGLPAGKYEMTTFHHDAGDPQVGFSTITTNNGAGAVTVASNIPVTTGFAPSSFSSETFNFTVTGSAETIDFVKSGVVGFPILNGFELQSVPEPSTFLLASVAVLALCLVGARYRSSRPSNGLLSAKTLAQVTCVALASLALMSGTAGAAGIVGTYVDAEVAGITGDPNGTPNTTAASSFASSYSGSFSDNLWDVRSAANGAGTPFGLNSAGQTSPHMSVLEAGPTVDETVPAITTSVTGLPSNTYSVYVLYWSNPTALADWTVRAKLSSDGSFHQYGVTAGPGRIAGVDTGITELVGGVKLYEAYIGVVAGTSISVDLLNSTLGIQSRTEYDGIAYVPLPEPSSLALAGITAISLAAIFFRKRGAGLAAGTALGLVVARRRRMSSIGG